MRGPVGTPITITVVREGLEEPKEILIIRDLIHIQSTRTRFIEPSIGYVRLRSFNKTTSKDLSKALEELEGQGMKRLILDLRNNPGGLLDQAVETAGLFLESGKPIVTIKGRNPKKVLPPFTAQNSGHTDYPMIVLVNAGSASASEIVAGALQDHGRAVLLGATTFGKGSVQTIVPLSDGSGLRLTTAKYYTPKDRLIQGSGIDPDIVVSNDTPNAIADDVSRRRRMLRERDLEGALKGEKQTDEPDLPEDEWTKALRQDQQLQRAIELLNGWEILSNQTATPAPVPIAPHSAAQVQPTTQ
jgi:carboxyl-terminal processing protease